MRRPDGRFLGHRGFLLLGSLVSLRDGDDETGLDRSFVHQGDHRDDVLFLILRFHLQHLDDPEALVDPRVVVVGLSAGVFGRIVMNQSKAMTIREQGGVGRADMRALGTGITVLTTDPHEIAVAALEVRHELEAIDRACSRFRDDSDLEVANRASGHRLAVGPLLSEAIEVALRAASLTDGAVDPTVGEAMQVVGYDRDFSAVESSLSPVVNVQPIRGWTCVSFDKRWGTLQVPAGIRLDLGATAKALGADRAAGRAHAAARCGVLVSLGGDISTAGDAPRGGWRVLVTDWHGAGPESPGQMVRIDSGALATSATTVRRWKRAGEEMHHIIDPATGRSAEVVWKAVSVAAATCVDANIASTASIVKGEEAVEWLSRHGLSARLVRPDGSVTVLGGWPVQELAA